MWTAKTHFNHEIYTLFMYLQILAFCSDIHNTLKCSSILVCFKNISSHFRTKLIRCFVSILKGFNRSISNFKFSRWQLINIQKSPDNRSLNNRGSTVFCFINSCNRQRTCKEKVKQSVRADSEFLSLLTNISTLKKNCYLC